ncbi:MAG: hypothetical protein J6R89_07510, partial [Clostridia bacterium]|nr:hypothetical protein [Clostridia bacterium]
MAKIQKQVKEFIQRLRTFSQTASEATKVKTVSMNGYTVTAEERSGRTTLTVKTSCGEFSSPIKGGFTVFDLYGSSSVVEDGKNRVDITKGAPLLNGIPMSPVSAPAPVVTLPPSVSSLPVAPLTPETEEKAVSTDAGEKKSRATVTKPAENAHVLFVKKAEEEQNRLEEEEKHVEEVTSMELPMDWENLYADDERAAEPCGSIADGFIRCLNTLGRVDIEYISAI